VNGGAPGFVLASRSPQRSALLAEAGYAFEVAPVEVDEATAAGAPDASPEEAASATARAKARACAAARKHGEIVLGADTVVVSAAGDVLGKPRSPGEAARFLAFLAGTRHRVVTGVCVLEVGGRELAEAVSTAVEMRPLSEEEQRAYVASGEGRGAAGAYAVQGEADAFVTRYEGSRSNVIGLPMERAAGMLSAFGVEPAHARKRESSHVE